MHWFCSTPSPINFVVFISYLVTYPSEAISDLASIKGNPAYLSQVSLHKFNQFVGECLKQLQTHVERLRHTQMRLLHLERKLLWSRTESNTFTKIHPKIPDEVCKAFFSRSCNRFKFPILFSPLRWTLEMSLSVLKCNLEPIGKMPPRDCILLNI